MSEEHIALDIDDLELGEVEKFEEAMGQTLGEVDLNSAKAIVRLVWIVKRRDDPKYTLDKARKIKISQLGENGDDPVPPTKAKSKRAAAGPPSSDGSTA